MSVTASENGSYFFQQVAGEPGELPGILWKTAHQEDEIPRRHRSSVVGEPAIPWTIAHATRSRLEEKDMASANAFELLILPILQSTASIIAAFGLIRLAQTAIESVFRSSALE